MYKNVASLLEASKRNNIPLHRVVLQNEMQVSDMTEEQVYAQLEKHYETMVASATRAVMQPLEMTGNFIKGQSYKQAKYASTSPLGGEYANNVMAMALSCCEVNAGMGRICAAPTAGSCGILPAVLIANNTN